MTFRAGAVLALLSMAGCGGAPPPPTPPAPVPSPDTVAALPPPSPLTVPAVPAPSAAVTLAFVGDINLGTLTVPGGVPPDSGRALLEGARSALTGDLVVGNFEGVLADSGTTYKCGSVARHFGPAAIDSAALAAATRDSTGSASRGRALKSRRQTPGARTVSPQHSRKSAAVDREAAAVRRGKPAKNVKPKPPARRPAGCYAFLTPTALGPRLREAGLTHLNLANNHANDFGADGRASTEAVLEGLGVKLYGPLGSVAIDTVRRGKAFTTVGLLGFTTYPFAYDLLDIDRSAAVVDSLRSLVDLLLVTFHGGAEGADAVHTPEVAESLGSEPRGDLRRWAHAVIDAGADAVIGHGPHVLRGVEFYRGKPIVYSLGNFVTYRGFNLSGPLGITGVLQLEFDPTRALLRARLVPMRQLSGRGPVADPSGTALDLVRRLSEEDFGSAGARVEGDGSILPPARGGSTDSE